MQKGKNELPNQSMEKMAQKNKHQIKETRRCFSSCCHRNCSISFGQRSQNQLSPTNPIGCWRQDRIIWKDQGCTQFLEEIRCLRRCLKGCLNKSCQSRNQQIKSQEIQGQKGPTRRLLQRERQIIESLQKYFIVYIFFRRPRSWSRQCHKIEPPLTRSRRLIRKIRHLDLKRFCQPRQIVRNIQIYLNPQGRILIVETTCHKPRFGQSYQLQLSLRKSLTSQRKQGCSWCLKEEPIEEHQGYGQIEPICQEIKSCCSCCHQSQHKGNKEDQEGISKFDCFS